MRLALDVCVLSCLVLVCPVGALAQGNGSLQAELAKRVPVTVAIPDSFAFQDGGPVLLRRAGSEPFDVLVLPAAGASPTLLLQALFGVAAVREFAGDTAKVDGLFRATPAAPRQSAFPTAEQRVAEFTLIRLLKSKPRWVRGVGMARTVEVYLPSRGARGAMAQAAKEKSHH